MKACVVIDNMLEEEFFSQLVALFKFQYMFLKDEKNYWQKKYENVYCNDVFDLMVRPSNYHVRLKHTILNVKFISDILTVLHDDTTTIVSLDDEDIEDIRFEAYILENKFDMSFLKDEEDFNVKMVIFVHEKWNASWMGDIILENIDKRKKTIIPYPNRMITFLSKNVKKIEISDFENTPGFFSMVVIHVKINSNKF